MKRRTTRFLALFLSFSMALSPTVSLRAETLETEEMTVAPQNADPVPAEVTVLNVTDEEGTAVESVPDATDEAVDKQQELSSEAESDKSGGNHSSSEVSDSIATDETGSKSGSPVDNADKGLTEQKTAAEGTAEEAEPIGEEESEKTAGSAEDSEEIVDTAVDTPNLLSVVIDEKKYDDGCYDIEVTSDFAMFKVLDAKATVKGETITVSFHTDKNTYDRIYLGYQTDEIKEPYILGEKKEEDGYRFSFEVPLEQMGQTIPFVPGKPDGTWYKNSNGKEYYLTIPNVLTEPEMTYEEGDYTIDMSSDFPMFKVLDPKAVVTGDQIIVTFHTAKNTYDKFYFGLQADVVKEPYIQGVKLENEDGYTFTFQLPTSKMGQTVPFVPGKPDGTWYKNENGKEYYMTIPDALTSTGEAPPVPEPIPTPEETPGVPADGDYSAVVETSSSMFKVTDCVLTSKNGEMTAVITLSGTGYDYLYMGTAEDAEKADPSRWIHYVENAAGEYTFRIPVSALDTPIPVAAHSVKKDLWYDRELTFKSDTLEKTETPVEPENPGVSPAPGPGGSGQTSKPDTESKYESDTSGSTGTVNSSTSLPDGVYTPDRFSWSGGTGRVSISCSKVTVTGGQAYATIVFSSDAYSYVKANGRIYYGTNGGGVSVFVIPVELNKNNKILGMTTKMSAAHEIEYNIFIYLAAAANGAALGESSNKKLDEEAPLIMGLEYESETDVDYAEYFRIFHYQDGITLLEIDMTKDTARDPEYAEKSEQAAAQENDSDTGESAENAKDNTAAAEVIEDTAAELYKGNVVKYLIVPEQVEIPAGLDKEMIVVQLPADRAYVASKEAISVMEDLELLDQIAAVDFEEKDCDQDEIKEAMENEEVLFAGTFDDPDYKQILKAKVNLAVLSNEILPAIDEKTAEEAKADNMTVEEQTGRLEEIAEHFAALGIPMIIDRSADEEEELGKTEWIKVYGVLFGCEETAEKLFDAAVKKAGVSENVPQ